MVVPQPVVHLAGEHQLREAGEHIVQNLVVDEKMGRTKLEHLSAEVHTALAAAGLVVDRTSQHWPVVAVHTQKEQAAAWRERMVQIQW